MKSTRVIYRITTETHTHIISCPLPDEKKNGCERMDYILRDNLKITADKIDTIKHIEICYNVVPDGWGEIINWQKPYKNFLERG